ncbi:MAG: FkbM family methyltransferase [Lachnospiraceae bacterium]|nr:FkbM family methyltransferase [Lachnospiraceae bacterium]
MTYLQRAEKIIGEQIKEGTTHFILYPFGEKGAMVKGLLNIFFGIQEEMIVDKLLAEKGYPNIDSLQKLKETDLTDKKILITSDHITFYEELREQLYEVVSPEHCIDLFAKKEDRAGNRAMEELFKKAETVHLFEKDMVFHADRTNSDFFLPYYNIDAVQKTIFMTDDYYESALLSKIFKEFRNGMIQEKVKAGIVADIGANIGNHTLYFLNEVQAQKVYAFEPVLNTFLLLRKNMMLNHLQDRTELYCCGLGAKEGRADVSAYVGSNSGATHLSEQENGNIQIHCLDDFALKDIQLIKIDVEGWELEVLEGAKETLDQYHPYVIIEVFPYHVERACRFMTELGYKNYQLDDKNFLFYVE